MNKFIKVLTEKKDKAERDQRTENKTKKSHTER